MSEILIELIILTVIIGVAVGRYPGLRMNRATIAFVGAVVLIISPSLTLEEAFSAVDFPTLALLFAMMIINGSLRLSGFFTLAGSFLMRFSKGPKILMALVISAAGVLSAFFLNDTIALMFTPLVLELVLLMGRNPIPYLIGLAVGANIGSMATIIGNPQNILIGTGSGMSFFRFSGYLAVPSLTGMAIAWGVIILVFNREMKEPFHITMEVPQKPVYKPLLAKSVISVALLLTLILFHVSVTLSALTASAFLLFTRRIKPQRVFKEIDISLLIFFAGLFIITRALWKTFLFQSLVSAVVPALDASMPLFGMFSALLSNLISNVPAVMLLGPLVPKFSNPELAWIFLAMSSTLAGNLTLLGSVANLIVAESAERRGYRLSFGSYLKVGAPVTILSILFSMGYLLLLYS